MLYFFFIQKYKTMTIKKRDLTEKQNKKYKNLFEIFLKIFLYGTFKGQKRPFKKRDKNKKQVKN